MHSLDIEIVGHFVALSLGAAGALLQIQLAHSMKIGAFARVFKLNALGVFLAVFVHSGVEFLSATGFIDHEHLMLIMAILLIAGSLCFVLAGLAARKAMGN